MNGKKIFQRLACFLILGLFFLGLASPAQAYTPRSGDNVVIAEGEVIDDDLYAAGNIVTVLGTIKGDLIAAGSLVTLGPTGKVEGDMMAAGQGVVVNGTVAGAVRIAGAILSVGKDAKIGGDLLGFGFSLETEAGSSIGKDLVYYGGQASISGNVSRNVETDAGGLELNGQIGGNVKAEVGEPEQQPTYSPIPFMPAVSGMPAYKSVPGGLTLGQDLKIAGNLTYTSAKDITIPGGVVAGAVTRNAPPPPKEQPRAKPMNQSLKWFLNLVRNLITLLLIGALLSWLTPNLLRNGASMAKAKPLQGFLWGIVSFVGIIFLMFLVVAVTIAVAIVLGVITLGDLTGATIGVGGLTIGGLALAFKIAVSYVSKILVGLLIGQLLLNRIKPEWVEHRYWPMAIGVIIFVLLASIPILGTIITILVVLLGLGALCMLVLEWWNSRRAIAPAAA